MLPPSTNSVVEVGYDADAQLHTCMDGKCERTRVMEMGKKREWATNAPICSGLLSPPDLHGPHVCINRGLIKMQLLHPSTLASLRPYHLS